LRGVFSLHLCRFSWFIGIYKGGHVGLGDESCLHSGMFLLLQSVHGDLRRWPCGLGDESHSHLGVFLLQLVHGGIYEGGRVALEMNRARIWACSSSFSQFMGICEGGRVGLEMNRACIRACSSPSIGFASVEAGVDGSVWAWQVVEAGLRRENNGGFTRIQSIQVSDSCPAFFTNY